MSSNGATKISERLETVSVEVEWSESTLRSQPEDESIESVQRETICDSNAVAPSTSESSLSTLKIDPVTRQALNSNLKKHRLNDFENCTNMKRMRMVMSTICSPTEDVLQVKHIMKIQYRPPMSIKIQFWCPKT